VDDRRRGLVPWLRNNLAEQTGHQFIEDGREEVEFGRGSARGEKGGESPRSLTWHSLANCLQRSLLSPCSL
jgi:hypothetical protein